MKSHMFCIIRKELDRFFGDRTLFFTTVIMPGMLIYLIYSMIGTGIGKMTTATEEPTVCFVENMPSAMTDPLASMPLLIITDGFDADSIRQVLTDKDANQLLLSFPIGFDSLTVTGASEAPNVRIWYNSLNPTASARYKDICAQLDAYESRMANVYDVNRADSESDRYDMATESDEIGTIMNSIFPMLLLMLLFSGCMAVAPNAIAGEKERGTIATLLITPMRRSQLALGKIIALSCMVLLSGLSSFLGIILALPKLLRMEDMGLSLSGIYTTGDYVLLLLLILTTTLIMVSAVSIFSALAKDVKSAGTMTTPFMFVVMICGLMPMLQPDAHLTLLHFCIPFFNSVECFASVFSLHVDPVRILVTILSNLTYTGLAVFALTRMFNSERIMFGSK